MELKHLTNSQLILLTLLVSFVTSIATGITTVALLAQAPQSVSQTINRVIQQTVENVVPGTTETKTIVIKEEDLIIDAIANTQSAIVSVYDKEVLIEKGTLVSNGEKVLVGSAQFIDGNTYTVHIGENKVEGKMIVSPKGYGMITLTTPSSTKSLAISSTPPRIGQSGIVLDGTSAFPGKVTGIEKGERNFLIWNTVLSQTHIGSPVVNTDGTIIGLVIKNSEQIEILQAQDIS
jgi:hypothetical protein